MNTRLSALYGAVVLMAATLLTTPSVWAAPAAPRPADAAGSSVTPADSSLVARGARLEKLGGGLAFAEGPAADRKGDVYFTDQPNDRILRWDAATGKVTPFLQPCGRANGLCFDAHGDLWACADAQNQLWRISPTAKATVVVKDYQGHLLDGPNDVWVAPNGGIYLTDPYYRRDYWHRGPAEQPSEGVYYLAPDHTTLTRVVSDLNKPNGIIGTPDGRTLYVSDIGAGKTYAYTVGKDGALTDRRLFCGMGSDGMTIDRAGDVYLTGHGVTAFDRNGKQVLQVPVPEGWTGNVCFGGRDHRTLFITASTGIYGLHMSVSGVGSQ